MRIVVITPRFPYPLDKGDKLRAYHHIRLLARHHEVALFALSDKNLTANHLEQLRPYVKALHVEYLRPRHIALSLIKALPAKSPFQAAYHEHRKAIGNFRLFLQSYSPDLVYFQLLRTMPYLEAASGYPLVLDMMDPFAKNLELRLPYTSSVLRIFLEEEEARLDYYERIAFERFSRVAIISARDRDDIRSPVRDEAYIIPNGIDLQYYKPQSLDKRWDVCFVGSMRYPSNIEAALFLAEEVMPRVWNVFPEASLVLVGADPPRRIRRLNNRRILVTGRVPDTRPYYAASRVFCAPMFLNTGMQNKILEAMAMELPVVTTLRANEAIGAEPDVQVLLAEEAGDMADHVIRLLRQPAQAQTLGRAARAFVARRYAWETVGQILENFVNSHSVGT
jgi:sugar transferase (PEP-CTERM/EpsH1 system associated)